MSLEPPDAAAGLTVATYNLYLGADLALLFDITDPAQLAARVRVVRDQLARTDFARRAVALAGILAREQIDVVGVQELSRWATAPVSAQGGVGPEEVLTDFLPILLDALVATGTPYDVHAVTPSFAGGLPVDGSWMSIAGANAVLVRRAGRFRVTAERAGTFAAGFVVATGLDGIAFPITRGWGWVEGEVDGRRLLLANTHTEAYDPTIRDAQRDELVDLLGDPGCPVVVVGDFNAVPSQVGMPAPYVDAWTAAGNDPASGATCGQEADLANETSRLADRIDYVFVRDAQVIACRVVGDRDEERTMPGRLWPSDHAGVVARLGF